jgi:APA family basic amino acid/polyamine antiporter
VSETNQPGLVRAIGRWSLTALVVNSIIGSGVFGLPSVVAGRLGSASPWAVLVAGAAVGVIMACFAEVASQFSRAGGPYLYARVAFGRLMGIEIAWALGVVRVTAAGASANLFVTYLGAFWTPVKDPTPRFLVLTLLVGILALVNVRGVRTGARVSNVFTVAKLVPLFLVAVTGMFYLVASHKVLPQMPAVGGKAWLQAVLLLVFAYGGFEAALAPMSEAKNPRRDVAFALFAALFTCTLLYTMIQWAVVGVLPNPAHSERPLADVATVELGNAGAALVAVGALISVYGYLSANMLAVPRITFALAEVGDFPAAFAAVHPRFRTPYFSILLFALLTWLFAVLGSFAGNVTLTAVARLPYYALVCAALPVLRRKQPGAALFRLGGGDFFAALGVLICLVLIAQIQLSGWLILLAMFTAGLINWVLVRKRQAPAVPVS